MTEWRVIVNDNQRTLTDTDGLFDVETTKTFNPFGDFARAWFDDLEGELFDLFSRGTKVEFEYAPTFTDPGDLVVQAGDTRTIASGESETYSDVLVEGDLDVEGDLTVARQADFERDFVGFVVNDFETDADGAEELEIEAYTFDQFLRGNEVSTNLSGLRVFEALETVVKNDIPPVSWNASNVEVADNITLRRSYQGVSVEEFLLDIRQKSAGEIFTVNESLEFVFELPEVERTSRDIDNSEWITHNINQESGETKNQVTVVFDGGDRAVTVDDSGDQLNIQDNLGTPGPAQDAETITVEQITTIDDAIDVGEQYLQERAATLTGPVTTTGLNTAQPGNIIGITINSRGVDSDFRIAENKTRWASETNELTVVEKKGADDDLLIEQSKTVKRVENRPRDVTVTPDRVTDTEIECAVDVSASTTSGVQSDAVSFVNGGRNRLRDALIDESEISGVELLFATDSGRPLRSDDSLSNIVATVAPTISRSGSVVTYEASPSATDIQTVALRDTGTNTILAIARLESVVDTPSVDLELDVQDGSTNKSVLTTTGQEFFASILATESVTFPTGYAYGSGDAEPQTSDTALESEFTTKLLDRVVIQTVNSQASADEILPSGFADDRPVERTVNVTPGGTYVEFTLAPTKVTFFSEAEDADNNAVAVSSTQLGLSGDEGREFTAAGDFIEITFTPKYDIPADELFTRAYYTADNFIGTIRTVFDGEELTSITRTSAVTSENQQIGFGGANDNRLEAGESHTLRFEATDVSQGRVIADILFANDDRFNITNTLTFDTNTATYDGPEFYPELETFDLTNAETRRDVTEAQWTQEWNNTDNNAFIEIGIGGTTKRVDNPSLGGGTQIQEFLTVSDSNAARELSTTVGVGRYTADSLTTPSVGDSRQVVSQHILSGNPSSVTQDDIGAVNIQAIVEGDEATGNEFAEAGLDQNSTLFTRSLLPKFTKESNQLVISGEKIRFTEP
ncbi:hypothetical protein OSG_eHP20_00180 [environmental Halophage eHP-20]|nr:hypothetical protein OSG_eHP20_00180 [environmental Halophage eHP-20]